jgi:O-antigen/teichoic acid export membrane protein
VLNARLRAKATEPGGPEVSTAGRLFQLAKESAVYGLAGIITRSITIFLVPIYTRVFTPADYGTMAIIASITALVGSFLGLGAEAGVSAYFYDSEEERYRADLLFNYLFLQISTGIVLGAVLWALSPWLADTFLASVPQGRTYIALAAAAVAFSGIASVISNAFRLLRRPWALMAYSLTSAVFSILLSILFVVVLGQGVLGNYVGGLLATSTFGVIALWLLRRWLHNGRLSVPVLRSLVALGLPYIPTGLALMVLGFSGRFLLEHFHSLTEVGLFSIATSFAAGLGLITGAFQMAVGPYALSIQHQPNARQTYADILTFVLVGGVGLAVVASVFAREVLLLLATPAYLGAAVAVPFLAANTIVASISSIAMLGCWIGKRTGGLAWAAVAGGIVNVAAGFLLAPRFGVAGVSAAVVLGQAAYVGLLFYAAQRVHPIPYRWHEIAIIAAAGTGVVLLGLRVDTESIVVAVVLKLLVVLLFPVAVVVFRVIPGSQVSHAVRRLMSRLLRSRSVVQSEPVP